MIKNKNKIIYYKTLKLTKMKKSTNKNFNLKSNKYMIN